MLNLSINPRLGYRKVIKAGNKKLKIKNKAQIKIAVLKLLKTNEA